MALKRCLVEYGSGVDLHGNDPTKAARRAVFDALRHSSPGFPWVFGYEPSQLHVEVLVAVPHHEDVRPGEVLTELPYGRKTIKVVEGGLEIPGDPYPEESTLMAGAAVIVSLDIPDKG